MAGTSRINREVYVRFCGRLEVEFLRPTRRSGGEMGNSRRLLRAQRAIPACKPECARRGRERSSLSLFGVSETA